MISRSVCLSALTLLLILVVVEEILEMQLKKLILSRNIAKSIYRRFVSTVEVDVNSLSSIKVKSKDFFGSEDQKVKFTIFDENKEINLSSLSGIELTSNADAFKFKCSESKDLSILLELPVETSQELQLDVLAKKSIVQVLGIQAKSIKIKIDAGNVVLQNLKSDLIKADIDHGDIETKGLLLGKKIELEAENGVDMIDFEFHSFIVTFLYFLGCLN